MDLVHATTLAILQGLTEFLPISSSAHLILVPELLGWPDQGLAFDVAVHVGTLVAVVVYFRREIRTLAHDGIAACRRGRAVGESRLAWGVVVGTVPVGLAGLFLGDYVGSGLRSPLIIAGTTIGFGLLLLWADRAGRRTRTEGSLRVADCALIGLAQALALVPGTSRSGITITAGLALGLTPAAAARFSFLLSVPVIALAGGAKAYQLLQGPAPADWTALGLGALIAGCSAYACIHLFLRALATLGLMPFIVYRLMLGAVLLALNL